MGGYKVVGGNKLEGEVKIDGAKNSILPILASVVLNNHVSVIHNCPKISDTIVSIEILKAIGCKVTFYEEQKTIIIDSSTANITDVPEQFAREMRSSIIFLGAILGRFGQCKISYPGGCELGLRRINLHLKALRELGAEITERHGFIMCEAKKLTGTKINLDSPSVGATQNIMLAAVLAEGETTITNAAKEPEIVDLEKFLNGMGAKVYGAGTDCVVIKGVKKLHSVEHTIIPDRIIAGTYLTAAAITKGNITVENIIPSHIYPITSKLSEAGCTIYEENNKIHLISPEILKEIPTTTTLPHPGFPTDMQPQLMALLSIAKGTSVIFESIFESRTKHIGELVRMGADIILGSDGRTSVIKGVKMLKGTTVESKDLRGGAALILAGLAAEGETIVENSGFVERGYEKIEEDLKSLGANISII